MKLIIVFVFYLTSCVHLSKNTLNVSGNYEYTYYDGVSHFEAIIKLNIDSTFEYYSNGPMWKSTSDGVWKTDSDHILLRSNKVYGINEYYESLIENNNYVFDIIDINNKPLSFGTIFVNNDKFSKDSTNAFLINNEGISEINYPQIISSITILYLGNKYFYTIKNNDFNHFRIKIDLKDDYYSYFNDSKWKIVKNKLIDEYNREFIKK